MSLADQHVGKARSSVWLDIGWTSLFTCDALRLQSKMCGMLSWLVKCRCIVSKCYSAALPALDQEFDDVDPKTTGMTARHFLLFCYYGGLIYTGALHLQLTACILSA